MKRALAISSIALAACGKLLGLSEEEPAPNVAPDASANPNDAGPAETSVADGETLGDGSPDQERVVFVTDEATEGSFGGLGGGDKRCNDEAANGGKRVKGRTFVAWLSTPDAGVGERHVHGAMPYVLPSGAKVANDWNELLRKKLDRPINERANGTLVDAGTRVWTGTLFTGVVSAQHCGAWTTTLANERGTTGIIDPLEPWTDANGEPCTLDGHIYCVEK